MGRGRVILVCEPRIRGLVVVAGPNMSGDRAGEFIPYDGVRQYDVRWFVRCDPLTGSRGAHRELFSFGTPHNLSVAHRAHARHVVDRIMAGHGAFGRSVPIRPRVYAGFMMFFLVLVAALTWGCVREVLGFFDIFLNYPSPVGTGRVLAAATLIIGVFVAVMGWVSLVAVRGFLRPASSSFEFVGSMFRATTARGRVVERPTSSIRRACHAWGGWRFEFEDGMSIDLHGSVGEAGVLRTLRDRVGPRRRRRGRASAIVRAVLWMAIILGAFTAPLFVAAQLLGPMPSPGTLERVVRGVVGGAGVSVFVAVCAAGMWALIRLTAQPSDKARAQNRAGRAEARP